MIISVLVGTIYSQSIEEENRLILDVIIFKCLVSLCAIGSVKLFINMKPKITKMSKIKGFFSNDEDLTVEEKRVG